MKQPKDWRLVGIAAAGLVALASLGGCESGVSDDDIELHSVGDIRAKQVTLEENPRAMLLIDSRSPAQFRERRIAGAINFTLAQAPTGNAAADGRLMGYESIVVYGNNPGDNSAKGLTKRLMELEYDDVYWFSGGLEEWVLSGGATEGVGVTR